MLSLSFMRVVDDVVGTFICTFLGLLVRFKNIFFHPKRIIEQNKVKTILCQKYFGMGSILNAIPLIRGLRHQYPNAKIIFLTLESNRNVVQMCGIGDELITMKFDSLTSFLKELLRKIIFLLKNRIDISIDLEFFSKFPMIISLFSMAIIRVGLHQRKIRPEGIMTHDVYYNSYRHLSEIYFAYASVLGIERKEEFFKSLLPSFERLQQDILREKLGINQNMPIVTINVNTSDLFEFRRWPAESYIKLIWLLTKNYPKYNYVLIGGKSDCNYVNRICEKIKSDGIHLINAAGKTDITELFMLIEMSYLFITNDSGPLHIASLYGKNIAAFFGPETPIVYGPRNNNALIFYADNMYCSPCLNVYDSKQSLYKDICAKNNCLMMFKPEEVYLQIEKRFFSQQRYSG